MQRKKAKKDHQPLVLGDDSFETMMNYFEDRRNANITNTDDKNTPKFLSVDKKDTNPLDMFDIDEQDVDFDTLFQITRAEQQNNEREIKSVDSTFHTHLESKNQIVYNELNLSHYADGYKPDPNRPNVLIYHNTETAKNKEKEFIPIKEKYGYLHFILHRLLDKEALHGHLEGVMRSAITRVKETENDSSLLKFKAKNELEGVDFPVKLGEDEERQKRLEWLSSKKFPKHSYFLLFKTSLQDAIPLTAFFSGAYFTGIIVDRVTMSDVYLAHSLSDSNQFSVLFKFTITSFFSKTAKIQPQMNQTETFKRTRRWKVINREDFLAPQEFDTQDIGVVNYMTVKYSSYYYVYTSNLKKLLENQNYKL